MDEPFTVCDVDPEFFKIVEGRPIRSHYDIKVFMKHLRKILMFRADCAYLKDELIQIDARMILEQEQYEAIEAAFQDAEANFVTFAAESYKEAKYMQHLAEQKYQELEAMTEQLEAISFEFHKLKNGVSSTVATYENLMRYKRFLNTVSPDWWREQYEDICKQGNELCSKFYLSLEVEQVESVSDYKKSALALATLPPELYFKKPSELSTILEEISSQCLNYMEIETYFSTYFARVNKYKKQYTEYINAECADIQGIIEMLTDKIKFSEERKEDCKSTFEKLVENQFQRLVASYETKKLFNCLQYVHTRVIGVMVDPKDTMESLTQDLEGWYYDLCTKMDDLNLEVVKEAQRQIFSEDIRVMRKASDAERLLKEYRTLCKSLYKSFEPPKRKNTKTRK
ncbi:uncharacterized protein LOC113497483 [Trichoplusia ni]|uniref:Uncharacterized protein LOC113497483 n=1 Tax=Trichoplusia ni TaxID=7111 RepID=A0A7E5VWY5_TRINI|nr:uncharacterized protein LOC113497483 [Trichoplusia ni]